MIDIAFWSSKFKNIYGKFLTNDLVGDLGQLMVRRPVISGVDWVSTVISGVERVVPELVLLGLVVPPGDSSSKDPGRQSL